MSKELQHTQQCLKYQLENNSWKDKWPNHCKTCGGVGSWGSYSYEDGPDGGPCPDCTEEGKCPRCGNHTILLCVSENNDPPMRDCNDYALCLTCGWNEYIVQDVSKLARESGYIMPHVGYECECWMGNDGRELREDGPEVLELNEPFWNNDPVEHREDGWYFYEETWTDDHGPFETEEICRQQLKEYIENELGENNMEGKTLNIRVAYTIDVEVPISGEEVEKVLSDDFKTIEEVRDRAKILADYTLLTTTCRPIVLECNQISQLEE